MRTMIDNVVVFPIERCLLSNLTELLSPTTVIQMSEEQVRKIAGEPAKKQTIRKEAMQQLKALEAGLKVCRIHASQHDVGK